MLRPFKGSIIFKTNNPQIYVLFVNVRGAIYVHFMNIFASLGNQVFITTRIRDRIFKFFLQVFCFHRVFEKKFMESLDHRVKIS